MSSASEWFAKGRLKLRHLQLLAALSEMRSLNRAAESLRLTQPGASRLLAEIETVVGRPLFVRLPRGLAPNPFGEILGRRALAVLSELERAGEELEALNEGLLGSVRVGTVTGPAAGPLVQAVARLQARGQAPQITVEVATSVPLVQALLDGRLDFAVARIPAEIDAALLDYRPVREEEICFVMRSGHPLVGRKGGGRRTLADLAEWPWILQPPGTLLRQAVDNSFRREGLRAPMQVLNTASAMLTLASVVQSDAIGALSRDFATIFSRDAGFAIVMLDPPAARITIEKYGLVKLRNRQLSPPAAALYAELETEFGLG